MQLREFSLGENFWKKIILVGIFFVITPITLFTSAFTLITFSGKDESPKNVLAEKTLEDSLSTPIFALSGNSENLSVSGKVIAEDARVEIVRHYLEANESELLPYTEFLVAAADKYGLDYRLLPAIAQKESGLCRAIPEGSHNCWGWGIHSKGTLMFDNYEEAIETVSTGLRENYIEKGYITPEQIMKKYAHPDSTTWAEGVSSYMSQME